MVTIGNIPVYDALITDVETGMFKISLVDAPAVMSNFLSFDRDKVPVMYAVESEEQRLCFGVVMRADFPIYRCDSSMGEYYIVYKAEEIRKMAEKYLAENRQNNINLMHGADTDVEGVQMVQYFIKDSAKGVSPAGFDDIADGSLFAEFHILNDGVWNAIKEGTFKGFSLEGVFDLVPEQNKDEMETIVDLLEGAFHRLFKHSKTNKMSKLSRFKAELARLVAKFGTITTDKGVVAWDGDEDIAVGDNLFIVDEEGNQITAPDDEYKTDENVYVVVDGKVAEIKDAETPAEPAEETQETQEETFGNSIDTDKGTLVYEGETLEVGTEVFMVNPEDLEGEAIPAPDGNYETEAQVISVEGGVVTGIEDKQTEEPVAPAESAEVAELRKENETLKAENEALKAQVEQMSKMPLAKPAHEEVQTSASFVKTGNKGLDNIARFMSAK